MNVVELKPEDFKSDQMVRWCAGCGDHAILNAVLKALPKIGYKHEDVVFVSGIGCSSRFPYYVNTYGVHGIHGRAAVIASGVKVANPGLSVWVISGDGDALAIGGNHYIHLVRRDVDLNFILFNNQIYGLTKGQYSPTSQMGIVTKTSPYGTVENPFNPGGLTIGAGGNFYARAVDTQPKLATEIFLEAASHQGTSVVEVLQNCVIFNDRIWADITERENRDDRVIVLKHGEKMIFGKEMDKGLMISGGQITVVKPGEDGITEDDILVHDAHSEQAGMHLALANMKFPTHPVALGIIRAYKHAFHYDEAVEKQIEKIQAKSKIKSMKDLLHSEPIWEVT